jgi:hypothetical protein
LQQLQAQRLLQEMKAKRTDELAERLLIQLLHGLERFEELGGRVLFEVRTRTLVENPELKTLIRHIEEHERMHRKPIRGDRAT